MSAPPRPDCQHCPRSQSVCDCYSWQLYLERELESCQAALDESSKYIAELHEQKAEYWGWP